MAGLSGAISLSALNGSESQNNAQVSNDSYPLVNIKQYAHKLSENPNLPFDKTWIDYASLDKYDKVMVDEVILGDYEENRNNELMKTNTRNLSEREERDLKDFAGYIRESFQRAVRNDVNFDLAEQPGPKVLTLKLYLVSIVAARPLIGTGNNLRGTNRYSPAAGKIVPFIAIEAVLADSVTGKTVFIFTDQSSSKTAPPGPKNFAAYNNLRQFVDVWSTLFIKVLNSRNGEEIPKPKNIKIVNL